MHFARSGLTSACFSWCLILKFAAKIYPLEQSAVQGDKEGRLGYQQCSEANRASPNFRVGRTTWEHSALIESEVRCPVSL